MSAAVDTAKEDYENLLASLQNDDSKHGASSTPSRSRSDRHSHFLMCEDHDTGKPWSNSVNGKCDGCINFVKSESLPHGKLPTKFEILSFLMSLNSENKQYGQPVVNLVDLASHLALHWIFCTVYPQTLKTIRTKLQDCRNEYRNLKKVSKKKRGKTYYSNLDIFVKSCNSLFDIIGDKHQIKRQEDIWNVKMTEEDHIFYRQQKQTPRIGYCTSFVCRRSSIEDMTRAELKQQKAVREQKAIEYKESMKPIPTPSFEPQENVERDSLDSTYHIETPGKKRKYDYQPTLSDESDDMPYRFRHVRHGLRSVRPEVYKAAHTLNSVYHMSSRQIEGAFVEIGHIFGRDWKPYSQNSTITDDTLPCRTNLVRTRDYLEAMALNSIVEEVMNSEGSSITYANDGSAQNKVGNYIVQSITVNGIQRALPPLSIVTESHESLKDLEITTLKILSAATGYKYKEDDIVKRIDFVMSDSTAHNIGVMQKVCEELSIEESDCPKTLLCNIHPLMMFQTKLKECYNDIQQSFGTKKLDACFTVDIDFKDENFILKGIKCLTNFVNKENSAKPWNRFSDFSQFISPKTNETISLKDHRFNRLNDCCLTVLYHFDDISEFLQRFENVTNNMAILDRSFVDMADVLKPIFCATAVLGHHIMRPFQRLLIDVDTTYETLLTAFPKLYEELQIDPVELLKPEQVLFFVPEIPEKMFKETLVKTHLSNVLFTTCREYEEEVIKIMKICLLKFQKGLDTQKGAIFGFGSNAQADTGNVLKICSLDDKSILSDAPTHNLGEERSVGMLNYELNIRGNEQFNTSSQNLVLNKSSDLIKKCFGNFRKFKKQAKDIKDLKYQWNEKMKVLEKEGLASKEAASLSEESKKLRDLDFLKTQSPPGPFTSAEEVDKYLSNDSVTESEKNQRLYIEIRYAKLSTSNMKRSSAIFKLKKNYKNLDNDDYAHNLRLYFGCLSSVKTISLEDFSYILTGLNAANDTANINVLTSESNSAQADVEQTVSNDVSGFGPHNLHQGVHVAGVWSDDTDATGQTLTWHIGVVESVDDNGATVAYLVQTKNNSKNNWMFPESASTHYTPFDQIIATDLSVRYSCATIIRCQIASTTTTLLNELFTEYMNKI